MFINFRNQLLLPAVQKAADGSVKPGDLVSLNPQPLPPRYIGLRLR
jgi:hypothetical protein